MIGWGLSLGSSRCSSPTYHKSLLCLRNHSACLQLSKQVLFYGLMENSPETFSVDVIKLKLYKRILLVPQSQLILFFKDYHHPHRHLFSRLFDGISNHRLVKNILKCG